jgi:hypothetical protein
VNQNGKVTYFGRPLGEYSREELVDIVVSLERKAASDRTFVSGCFDLVRQVGSVKKWVP